MAWARVDSLGASVAKSLHVDGRLVGRVLIACSLLFETAVLSDRAVLLDGFGNPRFRFEVLYELTYLM